MAEIAACFEELDKEKLSRKKKLREVIELINVELPQTKTKPVYFCDDGNYANILLINSEIYKVIYDAASFEKETGTLKEVSSKNLPVPELRHISPSCQFYVMEYVDGLRADKAIENEHISSASLGRKIAEFKIAMQEATVRADAKTAAPNDFELIDNVRKSLDMDFFAYELRRYNIYDPIVEYIDAREKSPAVIVHNDLHQLNLIMTDDAKSIKSVIDFGMARYTIFPETDFSVLYQAFDSDTFESCVENYFSAINENAGLALAFNRAIRCAQITNPDVSKCPTTVAKRMKDIIDRSVNPLAVMRF